MKRGLKVMVVQCPHQLVHSYNRFPDEKGTERWVQFAFAILLMTATIVSPMKRGLKDYSINATKFLDDGLQSFPR